MPALKDEYKIRGQRRRGMFLLSLLFLFAAAAAACFVGTSDLSLGRMAASLFPGFGEKRGILPLDEREINVLFMLRLPRVAAALAAGAGLGISGTAMQAITGNHMASPFTTGISSAAAFGAAAVIIFGGVGPGAQKTATVAAAFLMAALCTMLVYGLANVRGMGAQALVLIGIALNYLFQAMNSTMQFIANEQQLPAIVHWTFGSLTAAGWGEVAVMAVIFALVFLLYGSQAWAFNLLSLGQEETAASLGLHVAKLRIVTGAAGALMTAAVVSFTGVIGFVGLVAPHMARLLLGGDYRLVLPFSAVFGALLVLLGDTLGRTLFSPVTIPVGIVVSYVGVPLFLWLILRERRMG